MNDTLWTSPIDLYNQTALDTFQSYDANLEDEFNKTIQAYANLFNEGWRPQLMREIIFAVPDIPQPYSCIVGFLRASREVYLSNKQQLMTTYRLFVDFRKEYDDLMASASASLAAMGFTPGTMTTP